MFLSVKGGGVYVYQLVRSWAEGQRPYFQLVQNMTQYLLAVADDENRFAILYKENKHEYRLLQQRPFKHLTVNGLECLLVSYPSPNSQTEPISFMCVPTLTGALSFYQLGRQPTFVGA